MPDPQLQRASKPGTPPPPPPPDGATPLPGPRPGSVPGMGPIAPGWRPPVVPAPRQSAPARPRPPWTPALAAAVVAVAVVGDLAIRGPASSIGGTLLVWAAVGLLAVAGRLGTLVQRVGAGLAVVAAALLALRDSPWVTGVVIVAVTGLVGLLAADGLRVYQRRPWLRSVTDGWFALLDAPGWLVVAGRTVGERTGGRLGTWLRAGGVASVVVMVLVALLASGDAAFGGVVASADPATGIGHLVLVAVLLVPATALALVSRRATADPVDDAATEPRYRTEALVALWATAAVLTVWCATQLAVVLGSAEAIIASAGVTPAEYARQGFFQLVAAAAVALMVVNASSLVGRQGLAVDRAQRIPALVVGVALVALTVASYSRLGFYIGAFGLTMLRLSVATFLAWLALMTVLSVARSVGVHAESNWLPSAAVLSAAALAVCYGAANPERWVAQVNLERATAESPVDIDHIRRELGADARPVVADYPWHRLGGRPDAITDWLCADDGASGGNGPLGWNWSRSRPVDVDCAR